MEVVLSHSEGEGENWKCQISLRIMFDEKGSPIPEPQIIPFGDILDDPTKVETRLRAAQDAVLRYPFGADHSDIEQYIRQDYEPSKLPMFSRNVVRLEVSGSDLVDVTFIDLPGIISNSNKVPSPFYSIN